MTRILILHASLGSGHVSAARALAAAFGELGEQDVHMADMLDYASSVIGSSLKTWYSRISEHTPHIYRMIYQLSDVRGSETVDEVASLNLLAGDFQRPFYGRLIGYIRELAPDVFVCPVPFAANVIQSLKQRGELTQPNYVVMTDFMYHRSWINAGVTGYFVASDLMYEVLVAWGIDADTVSVTGIPVKLEVMQPKSQEEMRQKHGFPEGPVVTLFGGGILPEDMQPMVSQLVERSPTPMSLVAVAGRNAGMLDALEGVEGNAQAHLRKLGYIDYVDDLVAASDVVITKSGGLITSEVLARGTPMVIINPIPGQEEWNADFVASCGAGVQLRLPEMVPPTVFALLDDPKRLAIMRRNAQVYGRPRAALDIAEQILNDVRDG